MSAATTPQGVETDIPLIKSDNSASRKPEQPGAHNPTGTTQLAQPDSSDDEFDHGSEDDIDITADVPQVSWRCVSVNTRGMSRANSDLWLIWVIIAAHLLRQGDEGFRCRHPNDPDLHHLNSILVGPSSASEAVDLAHTLLQGHTRQWNSVMAWTFVVTLTKELDTLESWLAVLLWIRTNPTTAGLPIVLAVVHRDQNGFAHMHIALVPVRNGKRIGKPEPAVLRGSFNQFCKDRFGFNLNPPEKRREARKEKSKKAQTLGDFAAKSGAGPKGRAAANRRDAELTSRVDPETGEIVPSAPSALAAVSWALDSYNPTGTTRLVKENFIKWPSLDDISPARLYQTGHTQFLHRFQPSSAERFQAWNDTGTRQNGGEPKDVEAVKGITAVEANTAIVAVMVDPSPTLQALRAVRGSKNLPSSRSEVKRRGRGTEVRQEPTMADLCKPVALSDKTPRSEIARGEAGAADVLRVFDDDEWLSQEQVMCAAGSAWRSAYRVRSALLLLWRLGLVEHAMTPPFHGTRVRVYRRSVAMKLGVDTLDAHGLAVDTPQAAPKRRQLCKRHGVSVPSTPVT